MTITKRITKIATLAALLASLAACTNTQSAPNMVDYSYIPATNVMASTPSPGIQDF